MTCQRKSNDILQRLWFNYSKNRPCSPFQLMRAEAPSLPLGRDFKTYCWFQKRGIVKTSNTMDFKGGYPYTSYIDVKISEDKGARVLIHNRTSSGKNSMMFIQFDSILPYCLIMFPEVFPLKNGKSIGTTTPWSSRRSPRKSEGELAIDALGIMVRPSRGFLAGPRDSLLPWRFP